MKAQIVKQKNIGKIVVRVTKDAKTWAELHVCLCEGSPSVKSSDSEAGIKLGEELEKEYMVMVGRNSFRGNCNRIVKVFSGKLEPAQV